MRVRQFLGLPIFVVLLVLALGACTAGSKKKGKGDTSGASDGTDGTDGTDGVDSPCSDGKMGDGETDIDCGGSCDACGDGKSCALDSDCTSTQCGVTYTCVSAECANGEQDKTETGIDCGGDCLLCPGDKCSQNEQCTTGFCKTGVCDTPSCTDGQKNGAETGMDCGGECGPCPDGQGCVLDAGCTSGFCNASKLCAVPTAPVGRRTPPRRT